jgi:hypothetical protein
MEESMEEVRISVMGPMAGAATAAVPPVQATTVCTARSRKRMQGRRRGDESPQGERQITDVPVALNDSYVEMAMRPVIDYMS